LSCGDPSEDTRVHRCQEPSWEAPKRKAAKVGGFFL
jgi:hypothetical protein